MLNGHRRDRGLGGSLVVTVAVLAGLLLVSGGRGTVAQGVGSEDRSFASERYGYTVRWDEPWSVEGMFQAGDFELLDLSNGTSLLSFEASTEHDGDVGACLRSAEDDLAASAGTGGSERAADLRAPDALPNSVVYAPTDRRETDTGRALYVECWVLIAGEATLEIRHEAPLTAYAAEAVKRDAVLAEVALPEGDELDAGTPVAGEEPGVRGNAYTSPTYGYTLSWDGDDWGPVDESVGSVDVGWDRLVLASGAGRLAIEGFAGHGGDAAECEIAAHDLARDAAATVAFDRVEDSDEEPIRGGRDEGYSVLFTRTVAEANGDETDEVGYVECHTLISGEAVLRITYAGDPSAYENEEPKIRELLATIALPGASPEDGAPEPSSEQPNPGVTGRTYTGPTFGFELAWGEQWSVIEPLSEDGDHIDLTNGESAIHLSGYGAYDGDPGACLESLSLLTSVTRQVGEPDLLPTEPDPNGAYRLAIVSSTDPVSGFAEDRYSYLECRPLIPEQAVLVISVIVPVAVAADEAQFAAVREVLATLELPEG